MARRPELDRALLSANRGGDQLVVTKLDRLGRSLEHLIELSNVLEVRGVDLVVLDQGIDTSTAVGRMFFHILGAIAEFEHALMSERTTDGLAAARARGRTGGQKPKLGPRQIRLAREMYEEVRDDGRRAHTVAQIAAEFGVSRPTIYRHLSTTGCGSRPRTLFRSLVAATAAAAGDRRRYVASGGWRRRPSWQMSGTSEFAFASGSWLGCDLSAIVTGCFGSVWCARRLWSSAARLERVRRWLAAGPDADRQPARVIDDELYGAYVGWHGNVAAVRRELVGKGRALPSLRTLQRAFVRELRPIERAAAKTGELGIRSHGLYVCWEAEHRNEVWQGDHKQLDVLVVPPRLKFASAPCPPESLSERWPA